MQRCFNWYMYVFNQEYDMKIKILLMGVIVVIVFVLVVFVECGSDGNVSIIYW